MRKLVLVTMAVAMVGMTPAAVAGTDEKTYWIGSGDARNSGLKFIVEDKKVRNLITKSGKTECESGRKTTIFKSFDPLKVERKAFAEKELGQGDRFEVAGKFDGAEASGKFQSTVRYRDESCRAEPVKWEAEEVTQEEYEETTAGELGKD